MVTVTPPVRAKIVAVGHVHHLEQHLESKVTSMPPVQHQYRLFVRMLFLAQRPHYIVYRHHNPRVQLMNKILCLAKDDSGGVAVHTVLGSTI